RMRSSVDLPLPDGPTSTRHCACSTTRSTESTAAWLPKRFVTPVSSSLITGAVLQPAGPERDGQGQDEIADGQRQIALHGAVRVRALLLRVEGELLHGDKRQQRRVLDQRRELPGQRRQRLPERLREDDVTVRLHLRKPDRSRGL